MHLAQFDCHGFRGLTDVHVEPSGRINVISGDNAQGKTSLLEAVLYTATSKSHRTTIEADLANRETGEFHLRASVKRRDREVVIEANWWRGAKRFRVNGVALTRVSDVLGKMSVVLFSPEDIVLVKGSAAHRRRFLDMELSQIRPAYLNALQQYRQLLRQRNGLLRADKPDPGLLDVWDEQLARHGTLLISEREAFVARLAELAAPAYESIAGAERLDVVYNPDVEPREEVAAVFAKARTTDLRRCMTTRGPHRDDLDVCVAGQPARSFASQGQQKTAALAIKLAEVELIHERTGEFPLLMLDDVLSELDADRARRLLGAIGEDVQCMLTTANPAGSGLLLDHGYRHYAMESGRVEEERPR